MEFLIKLALSGFSIMIAAFLTPGMSVSNFTAAVVAALVISGLTWLVGHYTSIDTSPKTRGALGFVVSAFIIYVTGSLVDGFHVSMFGAIIGSLIMGFVDSIIPRENRI